ncbi:unnamed protein product, partial [Choristocarpus tenellus]
VGKYYVFTVADTSRVDASEIPVEADGHNAFESFEGPADLEIYGGEYNIEDLDSGMLYFVRVFAKNQKIGWGDPTSTMPESLTPRRSPEAPLIVEGSAPGPHALSVIWAGVPTLQTRTSVVSYRIEIFTASATVGKSGSLFGQREVQTVTTDGGPDGSFTLAFGELDYPLPGTVVAVHGLDYLVTSEDLTPFVKRGDRVSVGGWNYAVHAFRPFNATHMYLAKVTTSGVPTRAGLYDLDNGFQGTTGADLQVFQAPTTPEIAHDTFATDMEVLLETLPSIGQVSVSRTANTDEDNGYIWSITFDTATVLGGSTNRGNQPLLYANGRMLGNITSGSNLRIEVAEEMVGVEPENYMSYKVDASQTTNASLASGPNSMLGSGQNFSSNSSSINTYLNPSIAYSNSWSYLIPNLKTGVEYHILVSAEGQGVGYGEPRYASNSPLAPRGAPGQLNELFLSRVDSSTLRVEIDPSAEANGAEIDNIHLEWDISSSFNSRALRQQSVGLDFHLQAVRINVWQRGWKAGSAFSLSLFNFRGSFSSRLGGIDGNDLYTYVRITEGTNILNRTTPNATEGFGSSELHKSVPRGGFVSIAGQEFRVCLDGATEYDADTLTLCSPTDAYTASYFIGAATKYDNTLTQAPAYVLDTAIGSASRLAIGDTALWTYDGPDSDMSVNNLTGILARGDFFRLGHPKEGKIFSVCEQDEVNGTSTFNSTSVPICSGDDPSKTVSVLEGDIVSATYEIQSFGVWVNTSGTASTSNTTMGIGFRLSFGDYTSASTRAGGEPGCLAFGASAAQIAQEIEAFSTVDEVTVSMSSNSSGSFANYQENVYSVTFVGTAVAGNVPQIEVIDIGVNGCEAGNATAGEVAGETLQESFIPLYKVQMTEDLDYNARAADVKSAIESLTGACKVDVDRNVRGNGFEWRVTFSNGHNGEILRAMRPNSLLLDNNAEYVEPEGYVVPIIRLDLPTPKAGVPYYVRAAAVNAAGRGKFQTSTPISLQPSPQVPGSPRYAVASPVSDTDLLVQWESPLSNGGEEISEYVIEWDSAETFDSATDGYPEGSVVVNAGERTSVLDVQALRVSIDDSLYLSGTFSLTYDGQTTDDLAFDATAQDLKVALESLCTVGQVEVNRSLGPANGGFTWIITFVSPAPGAEAGSGQVATSSELQATTSHKLSANGLYLLACWGPLRQNCWNDPDRTSVSIETQKEIQRLSCKSNSTFTLSLVGESTSDLPSDAAAGDIEVALEAIGIVGDITVSGSCNAAGDSYIYVTFENLPGDIPILSSSTEGNFEEVIRGKAQVVVGRKPFSYTISGLSNTKKWHVRIYAYNHVGYSAFVIATYNGAEEVFPVIGSPSIPTNISMSIASATSAWIFWDSPAVDGGDEVTKFAVEWDTTNGFDSSCADGPEIQIVSISSNDSAHSGERFNLTLNGVTVGHCLAWNASATTVQLALRESSPSLGAVIVSRGGDGSMVWDYGYTYSVTFAPNKTDSALYNFDEMEAVKCGDVSDSLKLEIKTIKDGTDYDASNCQAVNLRPVGAEIVDYNDVLESREDNDREFSYLATDLKPGKAYRARVSAINSYAQSPWAYVGYPDKPSQFVVGALPKLPQNVTITPGVRAGDLHLGLGLPFDINAGGAEGSRLHSFRWELGQRMDEIQAVVVILSPNDMGTSPIFPRNGSYSLTVGNATTWCLEWDATAKDVQVALDSLTTVDGVSVSTRELKNGNGTGNSSYSSDLHVFFTGPDLSNGDQELMDFNYCTAFSDGAYLDVYTVRDGVPGMLSPVVELKTTGNGSTAVSGFFSVSFGYRADLTLRLGEGNSSLYVLVDAGSRVVYSSSDLSHYINRGDLVSVNGLELVVSGAFSCKDDVAEGNVAEYPCTFETETVHPEGAERVPIYGAANSLGSVHVINGEAIILTDRDLTPYITSDEAIVVRDSESGIHYYLQVDSLTSSSLSLVQEYEGLTATRATAFKPPHALVPHDASAEELRQALESLPSLGSVEVSRLGPDDQGAFEWSVTLSSFSGPIDKPYMLMSSPKSALALEVTNCGAGNGTYVAQHELLNGRLQYKLVDRPSYIEYGHSEGDGVGLWLFRMEGQDQPYSKAVLGMSTPMRDSFLPPTGNPSYWTNGCNVSLPQAPVQILKGNVTNSIQQVGKAGGFTSLARNVLTPSGVQEIQIIGLAARNDSLDGTFQVDFEDSGGFTAPWDISAQDMEVLLEDLSSVGDVTVSRGPPPNGAAHGFSWTITFETQLGDVENLQVDGNSTAVPISGDGAELAVTEQRKGLSPALALDIVGLEVGQTYHARVSTINMLGQGESTLATTVDGGARGGNNEGLGAVPLTVVARSPPVTPEIEKITAVSASQLEVSLSIPPDSMASSGANASMYKVEWTTSSNFGTNETKRVTVISDKALDDSTGRFRLRFGGLATYPLPHDSTAAQVQDALESLTNIAEVNVTRAAIPLSSTWNATESTWTSIISEGNTTIISGTSWAVTFIGMTGPQPKAGYACLVCVTGISNNTNATTPAMLFSVNVTKDLTEVISAGDRISVEAFTANTTYNHTCLASVEGVLSTVILLSELPGSKCALVSGTTSLALRFLDSAGLMIESVDLHSVSGDGNIVTYVEEIESGTYPDVYGYSELSADTTTCGTTRLGPSSSVQRLTLSSGSTASPAVPVTAGSYRLALDEHHTVCLTYNASPAEVRIALEELPNVAGGVSVFGRVFVDNGSYYPVSDGLQVTSGLGYDYLIRFGGDYPSRDGNWPLLRVPPEYFGRGMGSYLDCESFESSEGGAEPWAEVVMLSEAQACAEGNPIAQVILAEASSELGGSFSLPGLGESSVLTLPLFSTPAEFKALLESSGSIPVSITEARLGRYSKAWITEFDPEQGEADRLAPCDRFTTGTSASVKAYEVVVISTAASDVEGITGHFRFTLAGEVSDLVSHDASDGRIEHVLQTMVGVGKVTTLSPVMPGGSGGVDISSVNVGNQSSLVQTSGDWTKTLSSGDRLKFNGIDDQSFSVYSLRYNNDTDSTEIRLNRNVTGLNSTSYVTSAVAGTAAISRVILPGHVHLSSPVRVVYSYPNVDDSSRTIELSEGGVVALNLTLNSTVIISGEEYEVSDYDDDVLMLDRAFTGPTVTSGDLEVKVFVKTMDASFTRDISDSVSRGDKIWVENADGDVDEMEVRALYAHNGSSSLSGTFTSDYNAARAYKSANGRKWILAFKQTDTDLSTLQVETEANWRGLGATVDIKRPRGIMPMTATIGSPSEVQTVALRSGRSWWSDINAEKNLTWALRLWPEENATTSLGWGASAAEVKAALQTIDTVAQVDVERSGDGVSAEWFYGYVYTITFWGVHKSSRLPQVTVEDSLLGVTAYINTVRQGAAVGSQSSIFVSLKEGTTYSLRARAFGPEGYGSSSPLTIAETPMIGVLPGPPTAVTVGACRYTSTSLGVEWRPPLREGGQKVDGYRIEWDRTSAFSETSVAYGTDYIQVALEVQEILLNFRSGDSVRSREGTFTLSWGGQTTADLSWDSSASTLETAILGISGVQEIATNPISVSRVPYRNGYRWTVKFMAWRGNLALLKGDETLLVGDAPSLVIREKVAGSADIFAGDFTYEMQAVTIFSRSRVTGTFTLAFDGKEIDAMTYNEKAESFKAKLEAIDSIYCADVRRYLVDDDLLMYSWHISLAWVNEEIVPGAGDLGLFTVVDISGLEGNGADVGIYELVKGTNPLEYNIFGLEAGVEYYVRVAAHNSRGYGIFSTAAVGVPKDQPGVPINANLAVVDGSSLAVHWSPPTSNGGLHLTGYIIEWFSSVDQGTSEIQMVTSSAKKGVSEVQRVSITADAENIGGYYKLSFDGYTTANIAWDAPATGTDSIKEILERLPAVGEAEVSQDYSRKAVTGLRVDVAIGGSNASVSNISSILPSQSSLVVNDIIFLAGYRARVLGFSTDGETLFFGSLDDYSVPDQFDEEYGADGVIVEKWAYGYEYSVKFVSYNGNAPLMESVASDGWSGTNPVINIAEVTAGLQPISGTFRLRYGGESTPPIDHDASATDVEIALERLIEIGDVTVSKVVNGYGHNWIITFVSELGDMPLVEADGSGLTGPSASVSVSAGQDGVLPSYYGYEEVSDPSITNYEINGLTLGEAYTVHVRSRNVEGYGAVATTTPASLRPLKAPTEPENVALVVMSDAMLKLVWSTPASNGGNTVFMYRIEWDIDPTFSNIATSGFHHILTVGEEEGPYFYNIVVPAASSWLSRYARVTAYNSYEWGLPGYPDPRGAIPVQRPPGQVQNLQLYITSGVGLLVQWDEPSTDLITYGGDGGSAIEEYLVEWDTSAKFDSPSRKAVIAMPGALKHLIGGRDILTGEESTELESGVTYFARVSAFNAEGYGAVVATDPTNATTEDQVPGLPKALGGITSSATSVSSLIQEPDRDGGDTLTNYRLEWDVDSDFSHINGSNRAGGWEDIPLVQEMQSFAITSSLGQEEQWIVASVEVTNERQTVRTQVDGVDEVQMVITTADEVSPHVQTVTTYASDFDEVQEITLDADDIDEWQYAYTDIGTVYETQVLTVSATRVNEIQQFVVTFTGNTSDGGKKILSDAESNTDVSLTLDSGSMNWACVDASLTTNDVS